MLAAAILAGGTRTFVVPAVLGKVMDAGPDSIELFSKIRTFVYGASPMPPVLLQSALKAFRTAISFRCTDLPRCVAR